MYLIPNNSLLGKPSIQQFISSLVALGILFLLSVPVFASTVTVASPNNGETLSSPLWVRAHNTGCDGLRPTAFGYSIDNSSTYNAGVTPFDIDVTRQNIAAGLHTVHFKSWTSNGACPVVTTTFKVAGTSASGSASAPMPEATPEATTAITSIPYSAKYTSDLERAGNWYGTHDGGTGGSSRGSSVYPASTPLYDDAREFYMTYANHGGEIYHLTFGRNAAATHFVYDTYVYLADPTQVQNLEMDMNQVMPDGKTVILGTQCSSISRTWEYTTTSGRSAHWHSSNLGCNPLTWKAKTWHHVQIASHRSSTGVATYDWVTLDGVKGYFRNATGPAALSLGWGAGDLLLNFQIDGASKGSGSITAYIHKMTIAYW